MNKEILAYIIGIAIGDGNISNPNGRATRLRISCDTIYPEIITKICRSIQKILPNNKISTIPKKGKRCLDISCYSNKWPKLLGWNAGAKFNQNIQIPQWILANKKYQITCLRGLLETDGTLYTDRGYTAVSFTSIIKKIALQVKQIIINLDFKPHFYTIARKTGKVRYNVRLTKDVGLFLKKVHFKKI